MATGMNDNVGLDMKELMDDEGTNGFIPTHLSPWQADNIGGKFALLPERLSFKEGRNASCVRRLHRQ
jgi:hypothetical protein